MPKNLAAVSDPLSVVTKTYVDSNFSGATHASRHAAAGADPVTISEPQLSLTDITTNDVSTSKHGFTPKLSGSANQYLNGLGNWSSPSISSLWYITDEVSESTNSSTPQNKLILPLTLTSTTTVIIQWYCELSVSASNKNIGFRIQLNNVDIANNTPTLQTGGQVIWIPISGLYIASLSAGSYNIDMDWWTVSGGNSAYIRRARIVVTNNV